ncbi:MAG: type IV pilus assembly protein PilM [Candidatus Kappaea frigidicola]|nr:type IV pilus assembly protein PilM [Candidatus Kappaea frigidicola]
MTKENIVGLDIGTSTIKVVQLLKTKEQFSLVKASIEELKFNAEEKDKLSALKQLFKRAKISEKEVNISIEGPSVIIRNIQLPKMSEADLKNAIKYEAEKYIPYNVNEVIVDCQIISEAENNMGVLLVAAKKDSINDKIQLVQKAGLCPWVVDIDSFALINAFNLNNDESEKTIALLNIGSEATSVNIIRGDLLNFTRNIPVGGKRVTEVLAENFKVDLTQAEELKKNPGDKKEAVDEICLNAMREMAIEIKSSFDYYESQYEEGVTKIYISGGVAINENMANFLSENMDLEVKRWSILDRLILGNKSLGDKISPIRDYFAVATGLALRKL